MFTESAGFPRNSDWLAPKFVRRLEVVFARFDQTHPGLMETALLNVCQRCRGLANVTRDLLKSGLLRLAVVSGWLWTSPAADVAEESLTGPEIWRRRLFFSLFVCLLGVFFPPSNHTGFWRNDTWRRPVGENTPDLYFLLSTSPQFAFNSLLI